MSQIRVMYINHNKPTQPPIAAQMLLGNIPNEVGSETVTISTGDGLAQGAITVPLAVLTQLMGTVMVEVEKRSSSVILPKLILPN